MKTRVSFKLMHLIIKLKKFCPLTERKGKEKNKKEKIKNKK